MNAIKYTTKENNLTWKDTKPIDEVIEMIKHHWGGRILYETLKKGGTLWKNKLKKN